MKRIFVPLVHCRSLPMQYNTIVISVTCKYKKLRTLCVPTAETRRHAIKQANIGHMEISHHCTTACMSNSTYQSAKTFEKKSTRGAAKMSLVSTFFLLILCCLSLFLVIIFTHVLV